MRRVCACTEIVRWMTRYYEKKKPVARAQTLPRSDSVRGRVCTSDDGNRTTDRGPPGTIRRT